MHWRYSAIQPKVGPIDANALIPFLAILIWPAKGHWSFDLILYTASIAVLVLWAIGRRGYTPVAALLLVRALIGQWIGRGKRPIHTGFQEWKIRRTR